MIVNKLEHIEVKYTEHHRTAYVKKAKKGRFGRKEKVEKAAAKKPAAKAKAPKAEKAKRAAPTFKLSSELAEVLGQTEMPRGEALKKVWDYIRSHGLQDANNKRVINPDAKLAKVFGSKEPIDMFKMTGLLSKHLSR